MPGLLQKNKFHISIYQDEGVEKKLVQKIAITFALLFPNWVVRFVDSEYLRDGSEWEKDVDLFVMPGGRDIPYVQALKGRGAERLQAFVQKGGRYLGICAGAYFASSCIEFEKGGPLEVLGKRPLSFFKGMAYGPALGLGIFRYNSLAGAKMTSLFWKERELLSIFYHGGCAFEEIEDTEVICRYAEHPNRAPAIVSSSYGNGKAILCGVHPEVPCKEPDAEQMRHYLWQVLMSQLFLE